MQRPYGTEYLPMMHFMNLVEGKDAKLYIIQDT